jgi:integrase
MAKLILNLLTPDGKGVYFNGVDSISISKRLGHAKVSTTTDIYSHVIKQADEQCAECIANVVLRQKKSSRQFD